MAENSSSPLYVITDADEGVQINTGKRLGFAGAGLKLDGFDEVATILKKLFGASIKMVASSESDWVKQQLSLNQWEETDASFQQHLQALADQYQFAYAGFLPFADPQDLDHGIKGHMVRPKNMHLANKICFTLGGGEQTYNLGQFLISADWVALASASLVNKVIKPQIEFYETVAGKKLEIIFETKGKLAEEVVQQNLKVMEKMVR